MVQGESKGNRRKKCKQRRFRQSYVVKSNQPNEIKIKPFPGPYEPGDADENDDVFISPENKHTDARGTCFERFSF